MAITFISAVDKNGGGASAAIDTTSATLLVASASSWSNNPSVSDSKGNTWTSLTDQTRNNYHNRLFYVANPTVGTAHTFSNGGAFPGLAVASFSGVKVTTPFDQENGATSGTTPISTGSVTPSENNELVVAGLGFEPTSVSSINGGFTIAATSINSGGVGASLAYLVQTTAAAANPAWTTAGNGDLEATIATFKSAAVSASRPGRGFIF